MGPDEIRPDLCKDPLCNAARAGIPHEMDKTHVQVLDTLRLYGTREYGRTDIILPVRQYTTIDWHSPWVWAAVMCGIGTYVAVGYLVVMALGGV